MNKRILLSMLALVSFVSLSIGQNKGSSVKKTDVWDFGAVQLDTSLYRNMLDSAIINGFYPISVTPGSSAIVLPTTFTAGIVTWTGGTNDRLRTTNTKLTRYDANIAGVVGYTGRVYVNSGAATGRYMSFTLGEDDELKVVEKTDAGGRLNFVYVADPVAQTDVVAVTSNLDSLTFVAKAAGTYKLYDNLGKPSYFRFYRKDATYVTIKGTVDLSNAAGIPGGFGVNFTNTAGKKWNAVVAADTFAITVPAGYTYALSLSDANGYIITNGKTLAVDESTTSYQVAILKAELYNVTGNITGLDAAHLAALTLTFAPDTAQHKIYIPEPVVDENAGTYTVQLESDCNYTITASGVNDFYITDDTIRLFQADKAKDIAFAAKQVHQVSITANGLTPDQQSLLSYTFTNLNEPGYVYTFAPLAAITLRDGVYAISCSGLDAYPVKLGLTSNLKVQGEDVSKTLNFSVQTVWSFDDKVINNGDPAYEGLLFTGTISNEIAKGHLVAKPGATVLVPMNPGEKIKVTYYYSADFRINSGDTVFTSSGSTSLLETTEMTYTGTATGYDTLYILSDAGTSYLTEIATWQMVDYTPTVYVGADKEYHSINEALDAISRMNRGASDRVTVMIDPGNYEEMLVVNMPNITLKNASSTPSTAISNKGVDIDVNAVRITSYYGHGYSYYSMAPNQKWNADVLKVNQENGSLSYVNAGAGTTNGSYWNATVVVSGNGFEADDIIFENSYNQYISKKESEDVVVMWEVGGKGIRPVVYGNTAVQDKSFVERAAALAIANNTDKVVLNNCRIVGRQDALYGGTGARVVVNKGAVMGAVDYIFGGMTAVFYKTDLVMNTSDASSDAAYLTAAQQTSGRGFLMFKCKVKSTVPGVETASQYYAKPGYFGRPWQATTSEVVYYYTTIDTSNYPGSEGLSLISPAGWNNSLGGESNLMYEYKSMEISGVDNSSNRVGWSTVLSEPKLNDATDITTFNFTKGTDNWDPLPVEGDILDVSNDSLVLELNSANNAEILISSDIPWTLSSDQDWLTLAKTAGFGNANLAFSVSENTGYTDRKAIVTLTGDNGVTRRIAVVQKGIVAVLQVSSTDLTVSATVGSTVSFDINSNTDWTVSSDQSWLAPGTTSGTGNSSITLTAEENTNTSTRSATVTVASTLAGNKTITVIQDAGTSGIKGTDSRNIRFYPNPVKDVLTVDQLVPGSEITITDINGRELLVKKADGGAMNLSLVHFENGIYFIRITSMNNVQKASFIKQ